MPSPGLVTLRTVPDWAAANAYFQGLILKRGKAAVDGAVSAFLARYANNPCAAVIDAVLSVRWNWTKRVAPAVQGWIIAMPNYPLAVLAASGPGARVGNSTPRPDHVETIKGVAEALLTFGNAQDTDQDRFETWAKQAQALRYNHVFDPVGTVKGIGPALFSYLLMRAGADALKPDRRIKKHLVAAGLAGGTAIDSHDALFVAEAMAEDLGVDRLWFDQLLWA